MEEKPVGRPPPNDVLLGGSVPAVTPPGVESLAGSLIVWVAYFSRMQENIAWGWSAAASLEILSWNPVNKIIIKQTKKYEHTYEATML